VTAITFLQIRAVTCVTVALFLDKHQNAYYIRTFELESHPSP